MHVCVDCPIEDDIGNIVCEQCGIVTEELDTVSESSDYLHRPKYFNGYRLQSGYSCSERVILSMIQKLKLPYSFNEILVSRLKSLSKHTMYTLAGLLYCSIKENKIAISLHQILNEFDLDRFRFLRNLISIQQQLQLEFEWISPLQFIPLITNHNSQWQTITEKLCGLVPWNFKYPEVWAVAFAIVAKEMLSGKRALHDQIIQSSSIVAAPIALTKQRIRFVHSFLRNEFHLKGRGKLYYLNLLDSFL